MHSHISRSKHTVNSVICMLCNWLSLRVHCGTRPLSGVGTDTTTYFSLFFFGSVSQYNEWAVNSLCVRVTNRNRSGGQNRAEQGASDVQHKKQKRNNSQELNKVRMCECMEKSETKTPVCKRTQINEVWVLQGDRAISKQTHRGEVESKTELTKVWMIGQHARNKLNKMRMKSKQKHLCAWCVRKRASK